MELVILGVVAAVVIAAWWVMNPKEVEQTVEEIEDKIEEVVDDVKEDVKEALDDLPSVDDLKKLTKAKLEELGRELGVELDKRKTKANMINDLQTNVKEK